MRGIMRFFVLVLLTFGFVFSSQITTFALDLGIDITESPDSISASWENKGDYYKIYRDDKLLWEGTENNFKDENLAPGELYGYKLGVYKNNELVDIINYKSSTNKYNSIISYNYDENVEHPLRTSVGIDFVRLSWDNVEDDDGIFEIYRNQSLIGEAEGNEFVDRNIVPGSLYTYEIVAKTEVSKKQKSTINKEIQEQNFNLSHEDKLELYQEVLSLIRIIQTPKEISERQMYFDSRALDASPTAVTVPAPKYLFRYTTFINKKSILDPLSPGNYLKGDNRGFNFNASSYRSRTDVTADFGSNKIIDSRKVGRTERYDNKELKGKPIKADTASNSGIKITRDKNTSSKKMWRINHDVGVPFAALYPNITYYVEAEVNRDGSFKVRGSHDRMPSHEFYVAIPNSDTMATIFRFDAQGAWFLIPGTPQRYFEVSM